MNNDGEAEEILIPLTTMVSGKQNVNAMMNIESDMQDIKQKVIEISQKPDVLLREHETIAAMKLSEQTLHTFLNDEPDLYTIRDIKVVYQ